MTTETTIPEFECFWPDGTPADCINDTLPPPACSTGVEVDGVCQPIGGAIPIDLQPPHSEAVVEVPPPPTMTLPATGGEAGIVAIGFVLGLIGSALVRLARRS